VPLNYEIDTENYVNKNNPKAQQKIHALMAELDLLDVWRKNNPSVKHVIIPLIFSPVTVLVCSQYLEFLFRYHYSHITHLVVFPNGIQICFFPYFYN
jgi:hypothetical protein